MTPEELKILPLGETLVVLTETVSNPNSDRRFKNRWDLAGEFKKGSRYIIEKTLIEQARLSQDKIALLCTATIYKKGTYRKVSDKAVAFLSMLPFLQIAEETAWGLAKEFSKLYSSDTMIMYLIQSGVLDKNAVEQAVKGFHEMGDEDYDQMCKMV